MTEILRYTNSYLAIISDYGSPKMHNHLAAHFIAALSGELLCTVGDKRISCSGILIRPDAEHEILCDGRMLVFLFADTSGITQLLEKEYFPDTEYAVVPDDVVNGIRELLQVESVSDEEILKRLGIYSKSDISVDERVLKAIRIMEEDETISGDTISRLAKETCLSKSRLSHLFKRDIGISLNRHMAFMKMKKTYEYIMKGYNLTDASLAAGFDSSAHMAASCKRMFGIPLSVFIKSQKES